MQTWVIFTILSALFVSFAHITRKHVLKYQHPLEQVAAESPLRLLATLLLIPFVSVPSWHLLLLVYIISLLLVTTIVFQNRALRHLPISIVSPMHNISPILLVFLAAVLLGEQPNLGQIGGILLVVLGGYFLELRSNDIFEPLRKATKNPYSIILFVALVLVSFMGLVDKAMLSNTAIQPVTYLFWLYLFFSANSFVADMVIYKGKGVKEDIQKSWFWLSIISVCTISSIYFFYQALAIPGVLVSLAIPIRRLSTLIETLLGGALFHESGVWRKAAGCAIMVLGIFFIV